MYTKKTQYERITFLQRMFPLLFTVKENLIVMKSWQQKHLLRFRLTFLLISLLLKLSFIYNDEYERHASKSLESRVVTEF
jgi:hypothetical protein